MTKYDPLTRHLAARKVATVPMSFPELERLLGFALPPSARKHRAWWSNNPASSVVTKAWLAAGYQSRHVDLEAERLVFVKLNAVDPSSGATKGNFTPAHNTDLNDRDGNNVSVTTPDKPARRHPLFGIFKDTMWIDPVLDLTKPAYLDGEDWLDEKVKKLAGNAV